jgi:hypothetical protein
MMMREKKNGKERMEGWMEGWNVHPDRARLWEGLWIPNPVMLSKHPKSSCCLQPAAVGRQRERAKHGGRSNRHHLRALSSLFTVDFFRIFGILWDVSGWDASGWFGAFGVGKT